MIDIEVVVKNLEQTTTNNLSDIDKEILELQKKISELQSKKNLEKFVKIPIQRNQQLLKHLFDNVIKEDGFICGGFGRVSVSKILK